MSFRWIFANEGDSESSSNALSIDVLGLVRIDRQLRLCEQQYAWIGDLDAAVLI